MDAINADPKVRVVVHVGDTKSGSDLCSDAILGFVAERFQQFVGDTINWFWPVGSAGHNVVPDDGNAPATSGAPADYPKYLSFTFANPGVYRYHCAVHGGPGGVGMSGSVTVLLPPSPD